MVLDPFVSVGGLMGVGRSKTAPHPRVLGLASPWLAHSISPHSQKSLGSRVRGNDREPADPCEALELAQLHFGCIRLATARHRGSSDTEAERTDLTS